MATVTLTSATGLPRYTTATTFPGTQGCFGQILEGWQVNGIITLQGAQPWIVDDSSNDFAGAGDAADRWDFFGNPADFKGTRKFPHFLLFRSGGLHETSSQTSAVTVL